MILPLAISYLGIACGTIVGLIAREEIADGERYFKGLQGIIMGGIAFFLAWFFLNSLAWGAAIGILTAAVAAYAATMLPVKTTAIASYSLLSIPFFIAYKAGLKYPEITIFHMVASLTFLYGFPTGSLLLKEKVHPWKVAIIALPLLALGAILLWSVKTLPF